MTSPLSFLIVGTLVNLVELEYLLISIDDGENERPQPLGTKNVDDDETTAEVGKDYRDGPQDTYYTENNVHGDKNGIKLNFCLKVIHA